MDRLSRTGVIVNSKWTTAGFFGAFLAVIAIFFIVPVFEKNFYTHLILHCSFTLLVLSTIYIIDGRRSILILGLCFLTPFIFFDSLSFQNHSLLYMMVAYGFSSAFIILAIILLMRKILRAIMVNAKLIFAALMVYILSGILWANLYFALNMVSPGSFYGSLSIHFDHSSFLNTYEHQFNFLYYSFATLATLGMGDISPINHLAKSLTAIEAMFGQLFVAIIIAKLVSVWWHVPGQKQQQ